MVPCVDSTSAPSLLLASFFVVLSRQLAARGFSLEERAVVVAAALK